MNNKEKDLEKMTFGIAGMFGIYWTYSCFLKQRLPLSEGPKTALGLILLYVVGFGLFISVTKNITGRKCEKRKISFQRILVCFLLQFSAIMAFIVIVNLSTALGIDPAATELHATSGHMLFLLLIFNPIAEELVFRKWFADKLLQYGEGFYMLVSSFCFCLVHGVSLGVPQIVYTFLLGMIWSYLMAKTGDIKLVILMHALSNLFGSVIMQTLLGISMIAAGIYSMLLMLLGAAGFVVLLLNKKKIGIDDMPKAVLMDTFRNKGMLFYIALTLFVMLCDRM